MWLRRRQLSHALIHGDQQSSTGLESSLPQLHIPLSDLVARDVAAHGLGPALQYIQRKPQLSMTRMLGSSIPLPGTIRLAKQCDNASHPSSALKHEMGIMHRSIADACIAPPLAEPYLELHKMRPLSRGGTSGQALRTTPAPQKRGLTWPRCHSVVGTMAPPKDVHVAPIAQRDVNLRRKPRKHIPVRSTHQVLHVLDHQPPTVHMC